MLRVGTILAIFLSLVCTSCFAPEVTEMASIEGSEWNKEVHVEVANSDTLSLRNLSIAVRTNSRFRESELALKIQTLTPDGRSFEEECHLPIKVGRSAIVAQSVALPYRSDVCLAQQGKYIFVLTPLAPIKGIEAVGVAISDIKESNNGKR